jgi:putative ABC transport system ATP-binding protein
LDPILKTENLWKIFRTGKLDVPALRGVNVEIPPAEFVSIMGPSGCGKSTLLHIIGGLAQATRGRVLLDGNDLSSMSDSGRTLLRRHKVGFVFQRFNLLPTLDTYHNIALAQHIHGNGFDPHRFDLVVNLLGLSERLHHKPSELSGGEQQRVAIARAVANKPAILLADEPTGSLDSKNSEIVLNMFRELNRRFKQTIILVTHNPELVAITDRLIEMRDGVVVTDNDPVSWDTESEMAIRGQ